MADWFRNTEWSDAIAAQFEDRLSRARRKAEYLVLQGYTLLQNRPDVAVGLLERAAAMDDSHETARAALYLGTARALAGDLDEAIHALEAALDAQRRHPMTRTAAHLDQALLVALARREDLYDLALERLAEERALPFADQLASALIAQALIRGERGEDVRAEARAALESLGAAEDWLGELPTYLSPATIRERLMPLAYG